MIIKEATVWLEGGGGDTVWLGGGGGGGTLAKLLKGE